MEEEEREEKKNFGHLRWLKKNIKKRGKEEDCYQLGTKIHR